jgi:hypothetical protein
MRQIAVVVVVVAGVQVGWVPMKKKMVEQWPTLMFVLVLAVRQCSSLPLKQQQHLGWQHPQLCPQLEQS